MLNFYFDFAFIINLSDSKGHVMYCLHFASVICKHFNQFLKNYSTNWNHDFGFIQKSNVVTRASYAF